MESRNPTQRRSTSPRIFKPRHGTSRRSILKKSLSQEQVNFTKPVPEDPVVGIIGGAMSGLTCALYSEKRGIRSTVFDTGIHGLGGRMGTRMIDDQPLIFDHAAQFFTVTNPMFAELVDDWLKRGLVREWQGTVGGHFVPFPSSPPKYIGVNGMRPFAESLLSQRLELSSIWALMAAFEDPLPSALNAESLPFEGDFVKGLESVSWMADSGPQCWTFFSTATFGKQKKVPQESIPAVATEKVKEAMLGALRRL
ncbi:hypothetical protein RND71_040963 [Anisodus tanguticus]|uniref:Uncharacterized protein n=1 Tax=Anisodus tanguticus TaxID=243964 RepID=A0AAE1QU14_9SOLA|nr:hypothetical protein RND71_040963 [Anisodus tanguticus]